MDTFKPITLTWWQVGIIKVSVLSFAFLVAGYWPHVLEWTALWWVLFAAGALYTLRLRYSRR